VWDGTRNAYEKVPCDLIIARSYLTTLLRKDEVQQTKGKSGPQAMEVLRIWTVLAIWQAAVANRPPNGKKVSLAVGRNSRVRLRMTPVDFKMFVRFFQNTDTPPRSQAQATEFAEFTHQVPTVWRRIISINPRPPWRHLCELYVQLLVWLFDQRILRLVLQPARGKAAARSLLTHRIETVLFIYKRLVSWCRENPEVERTLRAVLNHLKQADDQENRAISAYLYCYRRPESIAVALTQWFFHRHQQDAQLLNKSPSQIGRALLFKKSGQNPQHQHDIADVSHQDPAFSRSLIEIWIREYLTP
jgi:hypothetical protein